MSKRIPAVYKAQLGEELAAWYRKYGKVAPRRAYHEDDEGGTGSAGMVFEGHPLLEQMPLGASTDLASIVSNDERTLDEANNRADQLTYQLQQQLKQESKPQAQMRYNTRPSPL
jgi:hypothetical protein